MKKYIFLFIIYLSACKPSLSQADFVVKETDFRTFKLIDSKYITAQTIWTKLNSQLKDFSFKDYLALKPLILEQDIPTLQKHIKEKKLSYETLVKFYLFRIKQLDRQNPLSLNAVISLNPNAIALAKQADLELKNNPNQSTIFGMPILLKDNINTKDMPTTAGAIALANNTTEDAFIVKQLKANGAIILGKVNLSEWAYFFCGDCPSGYSAVGGQTLNPYGRRTLDTGGSSSGSAVAVAANFCAAAVGTETAGSIVSPSSQNAVVGLKPTLGNLSRSGIVPISSSLDTPGPIAKNTTDAAILFNAMLGYDKKDDKSIFSNLNTEAFFSSNTLNNLEGKRFGVYKSIMNDSLYSSAIKIIKSKGAEIIELETFTAPLPDFIRLLNLDMKKDLSNYLRYDASSLILHKTVEDIINFNHKQPGIRAPYGQQLFLDMVKDSATEPVFVNIKHTLKTNGTQFFNVPLNKYNLDGFLSINNYHAAFAAVAEYPIITVPMGFSEAGEPKGLTFIAPSYKDIELMLWANTFEQATKARKIPVNYN